MNLLNFKRPMVVVAHPDDELLGLGATMHKLVRTSGVAVHCVILGEGLTSRSPRRDTEKWRASLKKHRKNIHDARQLIGYASVSIHDFPDNRFDSVDLLDIIKVVEEEKKQIQPDIIFTHHGGDVNVDHQRTFEAVVTACRPMKEECTKAILTFETPSSTEWRASADPRHFVPNYFVEVDEEDIRAKIQGMECYEFEKRTFPHPRSPQALMIQAQRWGVTVGRPHAEAFQIIRAVDNLD